MQENQLFEYAVIRVVPRVEREEFINVGVILYCKSQKFLKVLLDLDEERISFFSGNADVSDIIENLHAFERICTGHAKGGPIAKLPLADRFRWLTATRSTVVQSSKVHPGLCVDAEKTLAHIFMQMVG